MENKKHQEVICGDIKTNKEDTFKEKTGYECAKWLVEYLDSNNLPVPIIYVHSMNPVGSQKIVEVFNDYKKYLNEK